MDTKRESERIEKWVKETVFRDLKKKGVVIGLSGGIDSSVCASICVNALGKQKILGVFTPEKESERETRELGRLIAEHLDIESCEEDITQTLEGIGCYRRRNEGIRMTIPEYEDNWESKVVLPNILRSKGYGLSSIIVKDPEGKSYEKRMKRDSYLQVVASSNFKQRIRKMIEYYHAERKNYSVVGTPNKLELDLGFFVRFGDGAADIKPIAHLFKTQVYQLGRYYGIPEEIMDRPPTSDTYSLPQSQEEFYFSLPYDKMDIALYAYEKGYEQKDLARVLGTDEEVANRIYQDMERKMRISKYLNMPPVIMERSSEDSHNQIR